MSHYPISAELAAFRRSLFHGDLSKLRWVDEREQGIGYRIPLQDAESGVLSMARREASAMRFRAYALPRGKSACMALWSDAQAFAPGSHPLPEVASDDPSIAGHAYARMLTPTYIVPDFWDDESPRSPLPIAYRNPVTILADAR